MPHSADSIRQAITEYLLREHFADDPTALDSNTTLHSGGYIDSVSIMVLIDFLEGTFGIEFEPHEVDADNLDSIDLMVQFIQSKL